MKGENKKKVIVAMSGGVDSSVAAALLKKGGFDVIGVFMKFWPRYHSKAEYGVNLPQNRCCSTDSENRARKVAKILNIPFYVFNFEKEFKKMIVDYFLKEYGLGKTPNPCVVCNKEIKFGLLLEKALELDADFVATGHYARKKETRDKKQEFEYKLLKGKDKGKDQSYFLYKLNQKQLSHILFPVGNLTRIHVEKLAQKFKLPLSNVKKSMEICFVPKTVGEFLKKYLKTRPGKIVEEKSVSASELRRGKGKILGRHEGLQFYTIGQRKGMGLAGGPYYVSGKDAKKNNLIVSKSEKDLLKKEIFIKDASWVSGKVPKLPLKTQVKIRYRTNAVPAKISKIQNAKYKILFSRPQRAITPGQSAVFCKKNELLGGGIII
jgi:tRNA-uridine 2-sulfurtransferase